MIGQVWIWFWLSCKRCAHRAVFVGILLLLPVGTCLIRGVEKEEGTEIRIAVCAEASEKQSLEVQLVEDLVNRGEGTLFRFYRCENEDAVKAEVASRRAECGYVIGTELREKLDQRQYRRSIRVYSAPSTVTAELSAEVVFAALAKRYDRELFLNYVEEGAAFGLAAEGGRQEVLQAEAAALYDAWCRDGGTFRFVYRWLDAAETPEDGRIVSVGQGSSDDAAAIFPVRGMVAIYVFVMGLYTGVTSLRDEKQGLFLALPTDRRFACRLASMLGPATLAALSGLAALVSGGVWTAVWYELLVMAVYTAATVFSTYLLCLLCRKEEVLGSLIPFFLVGSLIFCPVMIDVGRYLPPLEAAGRLFLPWYYLNMF